MAAERRRRPDQAFLFGYEEALGYCVGEAVADKDGVSAALAFAHRTRQLKAEGLTLLEQLEVLYAEIGAFVSSQWVQRFEGVAAGQQMAAAVDARGAMLHRNLARWRCCTGTIFKTVRLGTRRCRRI